MRTLLLVLLLTLLAPAQETRSYLAVRTRDGAVVASQDPDRLLVPASALKLLTAARALALEPRQTTLWYDQGVLILQGGGDPTLARQDLLELANQVSLPVERVEVDPGPDLGLPYGPGWAWEDMAEDFQPPVCGLTVDEGLTRITVGPQGVSQDDPWAALTFVLRPDAGEPQLLWPPGSVPMLLLGHSPEPITLQVPVPDPDLWAGRILASALPGPPAVARGKARGQQIASHQSAPVNEILRRALALSDNLVMETLYRQLPDLPQPGRVVDGCGLSRYNLVCVRTLVELLQQNPDLVELLPRPGQPGTLQNRLLDLGQRVRAKTGTMGGVSALAGVIDSGTEDEIVFAVITNGTLDVKGCKHWEEEWVTGLATAHCSVPRRG